MATRISNRPLVEKLAYTENGTTVYDLPRDRAIRRLVMRLQVKVNAGSSSAPAGRKHNHHLNLVEKIRVLRQGHDAKIDVDAISKYFADWFETGVKPAESSITTPAANGSATYTCCFIFDFAQNRKALSDFSALLNARALSSLQIVVVWKDINAIYGTPNSASIDKTDTHFSIELEEVFDNQAPRENGDAGLDSYLANARDIREQVSTPFVITKKRDSYPTNMNTDDVEPVPALILFEQIRCRKNITDGDPEHADDVIDYMRYQNIKGGQESIFFVDWDIWHETLKQDLSLDSLPTGVGYINWVQQRQGGLRNTDPDAIKLQTLVPAPASGKENDYIVYRKFFAGQVSNEA